MAYVGRKTNPDGTRDINVTDVYGAGDTHRPDHTAAIGEERTALITETVQKAFPGRTFEIVGGLWEFENPQNKTEGQTHPFEELPIGDVRINFTDGKAGPKDIVIRATKYMSEEAVQIEKAGHDAYQALGVKAQAVVAPEGENSLMLEDADRGVKMHMVKYVETIENPDKATPESYRDAFLPKIGQLLARVDMANDKIDPSILQMAEGYTNDTILSNWESGFEISKHTDGNAEAEAVFGALRARGQNALDGSRVRALGIVAPVPKNIPMDTNGDLVILSQVNMSRGMMPLMANDIAFHTATVTTRHILMNPHKIESPQELAQMMEKLLEGYNAERGTSITVPQLTEAVREQIALDAFLTLDHGNTADKSYAQNLEEHIEQITNRELARYKILDSIDALYGGPAPSAGPNIN